MESFFSSLAPSWHSKKSIEEADEILSPLDLKTGEKVIDIACGKGVMTGHIARKTKTQVIGVDISKKMIELAKKEYEGNSLVCFRNEDILDVEGEFDKALLFDAFPHFLDVSALSSSVRRLLKKGGLFYVVHDLGKNALNAHHANMDHALFRDILPAKEEAKKFAKDFEVLFTIDEENRYGFLLKAK